MKRLDRAVAARIVNKLRVLAANARVVKHQALKGEFSALYRLRVGDYRVIYELDHNRRLIVVAIIGHRSDVYDE